MLAVFLFNTKINCTSPGRGSRAITIECKSCFLISTPDGSTYLLIFIYAAYFYHILAIAHRLLFAKSCRTRTGLASALVFVFPGRPTPTPLMFI